MGHRHVSGATAACLLREFSPVAQADVLLADGSSPLSKELLACSFFKVFLVPLADVSVLPRFRFGANRSRMHGHVSATVPREIRDDTGSHSPTSRLSLCRVSASFSTNYKAELAMQILPYSLNCVRIWEEILGTSHICVYLGNY
jgi:hypothetical protein